MQCPRECHIIHGAAPPGYASLSGPFGRVRINADAPTIATTWAPMAAIGALRNTESAGAAAINTMAVILLRRLIAPYVFQFAIGGPSVGCVTSQVCRAGDERAKANVASNKNGVVGTNGRMTPAMPAAVASNPTMIQKGFTAIVPDLARWVRRICAVGQ